MFLNLKCSEALKQPLISRFPAAVVAVTHEGVAYYFHRPGTPPGLP